jgi:cytochrome d ubiquinol oxidase subunit I
MTDFLSVVLTPSFLPRLLHVWAASWLVGASLVLSVSAWYLLHQRHLEFARRNLTLALWFFAVLGVLQAAVFGAQMAIAVTTYQPVKLAAMEGVWQSEPCTPMFLVGWVDEAARTTTGLSIPCLLSVLAYGDPQAVVTGLPAFPQDVWAPVNLTFQVYHLMIDLGGLFPVLGFVGLGAWLWKRRGERRVYTLRPLLWVFVGTIVLTEAATIAGWWTGEIGRQPWIVWNLLRTADAVSPVLRAEQVLLSLGMFVLLYALLLSLFLFLLNRKIQEGPHGLEAEALPEALPDTFREVFGQPRASS